MNVADDDARVVLHKWPECPVCDEHELYCVQLHAHTVNCPLSCYRCGLSGMTLAILYDIFRGCR